jgi:hypothetical protein
MIDAYSVPCAPASSASTGPGLAPCATAIGIDIAASLPAGTSIAPVAVWPRDASTFPTVKIARSPARDCAAGGDVKETRSKTPRTARITTSWNLNLNLNLNSLNLLNPYL